MIYTAILYLTLAGLLFTIVEVSKIKKENIKLREEIEKLKRGKK